MEHTKSDAKPDAPKAKNADWTIIGSLDTAMTFQFMYVLSSAEENLSLSAEDVWNYWKGR